jgi:hypothetical protein
MPDRAAQDDMAYQFKKHYSLDEARALLPEIRQWLEKLKELSQRLRKLDERISSMMARGNDIGGETVNNWIRAMAEIQRIAAEFRQREILLKDLERGLVDFPAIIGGREVFLCWEEDEEDIEFWHELDTGYAGRERL